MAGHACETALMNRDSEVSAWLEALEHPLIDVIEAVRSKIGYDTLNRPHQWQQ